ncbi:MAG: tetratricopeptide repeat protein [Treponema sp.]|nr:tetratricopeptide repeat protein [Treponema sp.]
MDNHDKSKNEQSNLGESINEFIQKNRKAIFTAVGIVIILFLGAVIFVSVKGSMEKNASIALDGLIKKFEDQKENINIEEYNDEINALISELETFAAKNGGFSGGKAWSLAADINVIRKDWEKAEELYLKASRSGKKTYHSPISLFNAAAAAEEQGKLEQALDYLKQSISQTVEFPAAPRAQFAIGRINEMLERYSDATEAYREILIKWPEMAEWQNLARSRIIAIEINN